MTDLALPSHSGGRAPVRVRGSTEALTISSGRRAQFAHERLQGRGAGGPARGAPDTPSPPQLTSIAAAPNGKSQYRSERWNLNNTIIALPQVTTRGGPVPRSETYKEIPSRAPFTLL